MLRLNNIYQTVSDRDNPDEVEEYGPFVCKSTPWLGVGYYFWDNIIKRAHWWGKSHYGGKYMICQAYADVDEDKYLDLAGNMEQLHSFEKCYEAINQFHNGKIKTISFVIAKLIRDKNFPYQAMRILSEDCGGEKKIPFISHSQSFLNFSPPMQLCIYDKSRVKDYHIIYPEDYIMGGVV